MTDLCGSHSEVDPPPLPPPYRLLPPLVSFIPSWCGARKVFVFSPPSLLYYFPLSPPAPSPSPSPSSISPNPSHLLISHLPRTCPPLIYRLTTHLDIFVCCSRVLFWSFRNIQHQKGFRKHVFYIDFRCHRLECMLSTAPSLPICRQHHLQ